MADTHIAHVSSAHAYILLSHKLYLQNVSSKIKSLRILRQQYQSMKPSKRGALLSMVHLGLDKLVKTAKAVRYPHHVSDRSPSYRY